MEKKNCILVDSFSCHLINQMWRTCFSSDYYTKYIFYWVKLLGFGGDNNINADILMNFLTNLCKVQVLKGMSIVSVFWCLHLISFEERDRKVGFQIVSDPCVILVCFMLVVEGLAQPSSFIQARDWQWDRRCI